MKEILKDKDNIKTILGFLFSGIGIMITSMILMAISFSANWNQPESFIAFLIFGVMGFIIVMFSMYLGNKEGTTNEDTDIKK